VTGKAEVSLTRIQAITTREPTADAPKPCLASPEGKAAAGDLANFADGGAELYFFDAKEVSGLRR
jgi:hypothetical protein